VALISWAVWVLYLFGALLIFSGARMIFAKTHVNPDQNFVVRFARKLCPLAPDLDGQHFTTHWNGRMALTPLALVLLMVETTDLIFALDSIPAIFAVTTKPFIVFTSNVFAILGLRSLYFVLAEAIAYFRYLKYGLSLVLVFTGVKMLLNPHDHPPRWFQTEIPTGVALLVVAGIILISIALSVAAEGREKKRTSRDHG
jgi:tellurite resistance protein TerC